VNYTKLIIVSRGHIDAMDKGRERERERETEREREREREKAERINMPATALTMATKSVISTPMPIAIYFIF